MTARTTRRTMTLPRPFRGSGMESEQPAGRYVVETDEELLQDLSFPAYRRMATYITLPRRAHGVVSSEMIRVDPAELDAAVNAGCSEPALADPPPPSRDLDDRWPSRAQTSSAARRVAQFRETRSVCATFPGAVHRDRE